MDVGEVGVKEYEGLARRSALMATPAVIGGWGGARDSKRKWDQKVKIEIPNENMIT